MKQSQKTLLIALGTMAVLIILITAITRGKFTTLNGQTDYEPVDLAVVSQLKDFNKIDMSGLWNAQINHSTDWSIQLLSENIEEQNIKIFVKDQTLYLKQKGINFLNNSDDQSITIAMPLLTKLNIAGASKTTISGFNADNLDLSIAGAAELNGNSSQFTHLDIDAAGAVEINFDDVITTNVNVNAAGANDVVLNMNGGNLNGSIAGAGSIKYYGNIANKNISIFGAGSVDNIK